MIVSAPTGLYKTVLPSVQSDPTSVTYTISNESPPRAMLSFGYIPQSLEFRATPVMVRDMKAVRDTTGELITTLSKSVGNIGVSNQKQFELGQVLEFETTTISQLENMLVGDSIDVRHNLNMFDLTSLGLTQEEQDQINNESIEVITKLHDEINDLRIQRVNYEAEIINIQKQINESNKTIAGLNIIIAAGSTGFQSMVDKLNVKLADLSAALNAAIVAANSVAEQSTAKAKQITDLMSIVR